MSEPKVALLSRRSTQSLWDSAGNSASGYSFRQVNQDTPDFTDTENSWLAPKMEHPEEQIDDVSEEKAAEAEILLSSDGLNLQEDDLLVNDLSDPGDGLAGEVFNLDESLEFNEQEELELESELKPDTKPDPETVKQEAYEAGYQDGLAVAHQQQKEDELERARNAGQIAGMKAGHAEGLQQGLQEGREALNEQQRILNSVVEQAEPWVKNAHPAQAAMMVRLIEGITRQVVLIEQLHAEDAISRAVQAGLEQMAETGSTVKIELHPDDVAEIKVLQDKEQDRWELVSDASISKGGCRISSDDVIVDSTIERRLVNALEAVKNSFMQSFDSDDGASTEVSSAPEIDLTPLQRALTPKESRELAGSEVPATKQSASKGADSGPSDVMESSSMNFEPSAESAGELGAWGSLGL